jgi:hypothetical protein
MEPQRFLFTADDHKKEDGTATTVGCAYPRCDKMSAPNAGFCPHHVVVVAWESAAPERKRQRAAQLREKRRLEEEFLAASPLRALNPQPVKPPHDKQRANPPSSAKSNRRAKIPA